MAGLLSVLETLRSISESSKLKVLNSSGWKAVADTPALVKRLRAGSLHANFIEAHFSGSHPPAGWPACTKMDAYLTFSPASFFWDTLPIGVPLMERIGWKPKDFRLWKELSTFRGLQRSQANGFSRPTHVSIQIEAREPMEAGTALDMVCYLLRGQNGHTPLPSDAKMYGNLYSNIGEESVAIVLTRFSGTATEAASRFIAPRMFLGCLEPACDALRQRLAPESLLRVESVERAGQRWGVVQISPDGFRQIKENSSFLDAFLFTGGEEPP